MENWFRILNGQISSIFDSYLPATSPYFHFQMITLVNVSKFSPNLVCALILWRSDLGLLMDKFRQFLTVICLLYFHFWRITLENIYECSSNLVCTLILWTSAPWDCEWVNFVHFWQLSARNTSIFYLQDHNLSKSQWIFTKFDMCIDIVGMLIGKFCQFWTELSAHNIIMTGYYRFTFYFSITTCCGYSLEGPHLGSSDQYHSICFCREIKITVFFHWKKRPIWNYVTSNFTGMVRQGH